VVPAEALEVGVAVAVAVGVAVLVAVLVAVAVAVGVPAVCCTVTFIEAVATMVPLDANPVADNVCGPFATVVVFQLKVSGGVAPKNSPST
jgi:hypothetical protein